MNYASTEVIRNGFLRSSIIITFCSVHRMKMELKTNGLQDEHAIHFSTKKMIGTILMQSVID